MAAGQDDDQIIAAMVQRRVDPVKAIQLVDDLRHGRKVTAQPALPAEFTLRHTRSRSAAREGEASAPKRSRKQTSRPSPPSAPAAPGRKKPALIWVVAGVFLFLMLVVLGSILFQRYQPGMGSPAEETSGPGSTNTNHVPRESPTGTVQRTNVASPATLALELEPDGLRFRGKTVNRDNLLLTMVTLLGPPSRTNQVSQTKTVVYAFDQHGLLIYSQPAGGTNSIVLDCEASGGVNGTTSPFVGTLRVEARVIGPDTDSKTLAAIKQLNLVVPKADGTIWNGRYKDVDLVFAYLRSPRRPSLIELDLK